MRVIRSGVRLHCYFFLAFVSLYLHINLRTARNKVRLRERIVSFKLISARYKLASARGKKKSELRDSVLYGTFCNPSFNAA